MMLSYLDSDELIFTLSLGLTGLWLYLSLSHRKRQDRNPMRTVVFVCLLVHSLYNVFSTHYRKPVNIFSSLNIPLNEPVDSIRATLLYVTKEPSLQINLDRLISRLNSFDARVAYVRFGHNAVQECDFCVKQEDFMFYALARPLLEYVREAAVVGIATIRGTGRDYYRYRGLIGLAIGGLLEAYHVLTTKIVLVPQQGVVTLMVHDNSLRARRLFFLILPLAISLLPTKDIRSPLSALPQLVGLAESAAERLHLARYMSSARERHPDLCNLAGQWGGRRRSEAARAIDDAELCELAEKLGMDVTEGGDLRKKARGIVDAMRKRLEHGP